MSILERKNLHDLTSMVRNISLTLDLECLVHVQNAVLVPVPGHDISHFLLGLDNYIPDALLELDDGSGVDNVVKVELLEPIVEPLLVFVLGDDDGVDILPACCNVLVVHARPAVEATRHHGLDSAELLEELLVLELVEVGGEVLGCSARRPHELDQLVGDVLDSRLKLLEPFGELLLVALD